MRRVIIGVLVYIRLNQVGLEPQSNMDAAIRVYYTCIAKETRSRIRYVTAPEMCSSPAEYQVGSDIW